MPPPTAASNRSDAPRPAGDRLELRPVVGDDVLVGGHDRLARAERRGDQRAGRLVAAHQLDDDVDVVVRDEVGRRVGQRASAGSPRPTARADVAHGDADELERPRRRRRAGSVGRSRSARTTSRPTVPAPSTRDAQRAPLMAGIGRVATSAEW